MCNFVHEFHPDGGTVSATDLLKDNLNWVTRAREDQYPSMHEKKHCRDLQNAQLTFLEMVVIYQKTDELYTLDGYLSKWNIQCYPNLPVPLLGVTEAGPPSNVLEETQSMAARAVSSTIAVAGPPATARPMREFAEQPDEEMWKDDSGHA